MKAIVLLFLLCLLFASIPTATAEAEMTRFIESVEMSVGTIFSGTMASLRSEDGNLLVLRMGLSGTYKVIAWANTTLDSTAGDPLRAEWNCHLFAFNSMATATLSIVNENGTLRTLAIGNPSGRPCTELHETANLTVNDMWANRIHFKLTTSGQSSPPDGGVEFDLLIVKGRFPPFIQQGFNLLPIFAFVGGLSLLIVAAIWIRDRRR